MPGRFDRRSLIALMAGAGLGPFGRPAAARSAAMWGYPIVWEKGVPGDGFFIKHGYGCENTTYYPGLTHTGENWYGLAKNAAGAIAIAVAAGEVVFADYD
ncbi:MAG: hypothetical protein IT336_13520 [Thermomicrobiales bacterium]|nr:hypothetical protein [Thermomicrobiales bacterium]